MFRTSEPQEQKPAPTTTPANDNNFDFTAFSKAMGDAVTAAVKPALDAVGEVRGELANMKGQLENTPAGFSRPPASGGAGQHLTDC
ncbi:hypothetical protein [Sphingomonas sp.]|uniref:hypothetical protein n=1 Tax=Sphingomonas sp. TaxID=28214 RepID=UPI0028A8CF37|nr:hypothetical protein [Sphingomonas sp.]